MVPDDVSIVIPALNEEAAIGILVTALREKLPEAQLTVVDDGSTDGTPRLAADAGARVISHDRCRGYGASLRSGVTASTREYVLFCDGDGQHSVEDVVRLVAACDDCEMLVGARDSKSHVPFVRAPGKFLLRRFANFLAGERIPDLNSGLRIVRKSTLLKYLHLMPPGFSFSTTTTMALLKGNHRVQWQPITVAKRVGKSTVRQWKHGPQTIMLMLRLTVLFEPLKVFLYAAAFLFVLSTASFVVDLEANKGFGIGDTTAMLSVSTLLVFLFGLVCDQISALRREFHA
ncbi:glycosyltransferase family 2 protein [Planctomycetota bacterium]